MVEGEDCLVASDYFRDHHSVSYVAVKMIEEARAEILLSSGVSDVIMDGHKATGLFVENKSGTLAIKSKERVYIYEFAVFLRAHVPGFEEATLHVVAPLTCARGGKSIARMLLPVQMTAHSDRQKTCAPFRCRRTETSRPANALRSPLPRQVTMRPNSSPTSGSAASRPQPGKPSTSCGGVCGGSTSARERCRRRRGMGSAASQS